LKKRTKKLLLNDVLRQILLHSNRHSRASGDPRLLNLKRSGIATAKSAGKSKFFNFFCSQKEVLTAFALP
jgi:hypothetical protein